MNQKGFSYLVILIPVIIIVTTGLYFYKSSLQEEVTPKVVVSPAAIPTSSPSAPTLKPMGNGLKRHENPNYEITFPETWISESPISSMPGYDFFANEELTDEGLYHPGRVSLNISTETIDPTQDTFINDQFNDSVGTVRDGVKSKTTKVANLDINGLKAAKVFSTSEGKPTEAYHETYYWIKINDKNYYLLKFGTEVEDKGKFDEVMDQIANSFRVN